MKFSPEIHAKSGRTKFAPTTCRGGRSRRSACVADSTFALLPQCKSFGKTPFGQFFLRLVGDGVLDVPFVLPNIAESQTTAYPMRFDFRIASAMQKLRKNSLRAVFPTTSSVLFSFYFRLMLIPDAIRLSHCSRNAKASEKLPSGSFSYDKFESLH